MPPRDDTTQMSAPSNTPRRRWYDRIGPTTPLFAALVLMGIIQAAAGDWGMTIILALTIGWITLRERAHRRD